MSPSLIIWLFRTIYPEEHGWFVRIRFYSSGTVGQGDGKTNPAIFMMIYNNIVTLHFKHFTLNCQYAN